MRTIVIISRNALESSQRGVQMRHVSNKHTKQERITASHGVMEAFHAQCGREKNLQQLSTIDFQILSESSRPAAT